MSSLAPDRISHIVDRSLVHRVADLYDHYRIVLGRPERAPGDQGDGQSHKGGEQNETHPMRVTICPVTSVGLPMATLHSMHTILLVADRQNLIDQIHASLASADVLIIDHPDSDTAAVTAYEKKVDVVLVGMQVGTMGAMAVARDVRAKAGSADEIPVTILLDREADSFLAGRSGARNWLLKNAPVSDLQAAVAPEPTVAT